MVHDNSLQVVENRLRLGFYVDIQILDQNFSRSVFLSKPKFLSIKMRFLGAFISSEISEKSACCWQIFEFDSAKFKFKVLIYEALYGVLVVLQFVGKY